MAITEILIGTRFVRYSSKRKDIETVYDILSTYNSKGELVRVRYLTEYELLGQRVTDEIPAATIARSEIVYTPVDVSLIDMNEDQKSLTNYVANDIAYKLQTALTKLTPIQ